MSEENNNKQAEEQQEQPGSSAEFKLEEPENENPEVVEVPWEKLQQTFEMREALRETQTYVSDFLLQTERRKIRFLSEIENIERAMYDSATAIRNDCALNPEWTYEFKLPSKEGEKGYFIRKERPADTI